MVLPNSAQNKFLWSSFQAICYESKRLWEKICYNIVFTMDALCAWCHSNTSRSTRDAIDSLWTEGLYVEFRVKQGFYGAPRSSKSTWNTKPTQQCLTSLGHHNTFEWVMWTHVAISVASIRVSVLIYGAYITSLLHFNWAHLQYPCSQWLKCHAVHVVLYFWWVLKFFHVAIWMLRVMGMHVFSLLLVNLNLDFIIIKLLI